MKCERYYQWSNKRISRPTALSSHYLTGWQFFPVSFASHGIAVAKRMVKQVEVTFFSSDKKIEWPCYIEHYWENTRIRSSTWIKVGCRKRIYYQTTRVIYWNLLRITSTSATMWYDIFHLFVGRNKKRIPVMEGNFWSNINIEGHIANLHCLHFDTLKNIWSFLLTLISLNFH